MGLGQVFRAALVGNFLRTGGYANYLPPLATNNKAALTENKNQTKRFGIKGKGGKKHWKATRRAHALFPSAPVGRALKTIFAPASRLPLCRAGAFEPVMPWISELNVFFAPLGGLALVALEYMRDRSLDRIQRRTMLGIAGFAALAIFCELFGAVYSGVPGGLAHTIVYCANFSFFVFQLLAFSGIPIFFDYYVNQDVRRVKRLILVLAAISAANLLVLAANIHGEFYFYVSSENVYTRGHIHFVRVLFTFSPLAVMVVDWLLARKQIGAHRFWLCAFLILPPALCGIMDLAIEGSRLLWPCFCLSLFFAHLFMVKADYSRDGLTGLYNRRRCNEYLADLGRGQRRKRYLFLMIDMDDFKRINDTYGHTQGDNALEDAAGILKKSVRHRDFVARYGGDEFLLILEDNPSVRDVRGRISRELTALNTSNTRPYVLSMSIGHGVYEPTDPRSPQEFLEQVDRQMFLHKQEQRDAPDKA